MTIETSLRYRAKKSQRIAILWLSLAVVILVSTYIFIPFTMDKVLNSIMNIGGQITGTVHNITVDTNVQFLVLALTIFGFLIILFACFLLGRQVVIETELAARLNGLADALCIAGNDFEQLEKAISFLVPKGKHLSGSEIFSAKTISSLIDILKQIKTI